MPSELLSTERPTRRRLQSFLAIALGAAASGVGALLPWATVGFAGDRSHAFDATVIGIDVWEGVVVLAVAALALVALIVMRVARTRRTRVGIAAAVAAGGLAVAVLAGLDALRAEDRFAGSDGLDRVARVLADRSGQTIETIRSLLERNLHAVVRVELGPGLVVALVGGIVLVAGGALAMRWARESAEPETVPAFADEDGEANPG